DRAVADECGRSAKQIDREIVSQTLRGVVDDRVADQRDGFQYRLLTLTLEAAGEFDASRLAEWILHNAGKVIEAEDVALLLDDVGRHELSIDVDQRASDASRRKDVREMCVVDAPIQPVLLVEIEDFAGNLIRECADAGRSLALECEAYVVLAQHI